MDNLDIIKEYIRYDSDSGVLYWKKRYSNSNNISVGDEVGSKRKTGYRDFSFKGKKYQTHRIIWLFEHGKMPSGEIDHIDGNVGNNHISNLRDVSKRENAQNKRWHRAGKLVGAYWDNEKRRWISRARVPLGRHKYLGSFKTAEEAHAAYLQFVGSL